MAADYLKLAQEAFEASTSYFDANLRTDLDYSIRAFRNEHASGSKYMSDEYKSRSRIFRPKTRSIIRKNEAAAAVALFSNMEVVNLTPGNPDDLMNVASTAVMKEILEYRLTKTIPAFQVCMGGLQDAQTTGTVCSYQYWEFEQRDGRKYKDQPCIELRPIENIRLDHGASWLDPVGTSPYFCDIIPMYVCDVKSMMQNEDSKTGAPKWKNFSDQIIEKAKPAAMDASRQARYGDKQDPHQESTGIKDFDIVWVLRWFMKIGGEDKTYYTLGTEELLTVPQNIDEVYFHGKRPYVIGCAILETHKVLKSGLPMLIKPLQLESTEIANQRLDNVKFVLNKRWLVARGRQVDVQSLVRNVPGGVTLMTDPKTDVMESNWPDVTSSAYAEQDRLNADLDDLAGNFTPSTVVANKGINDTLGGSRMAAQGASLMTDYLLRTVIETWWEPVLRQLVLLEQYYETDSIVLGLVANKARLFPRFGLSQVTDEMLMNEVELSVNVGMGSSNPKERQQNFLSATSAVIQLIGTAPPGSNVKEMIKEIYSNAGYRDGARFFNEQQDPQLMKAMQMVQMLKQQVEGKQLELQAGLKDTQLKLVSSEKIKGAEIMVDKNRIEGDLRIKEAELMVEKERIDLEKLKLQIELAQLDQEYQLKSAALNSDNETARLKLEGEKQKLIGLSMKMGHEIEKAAFDLETAKATAKDQQQNDEKISQVADKVGQSMKTVAEEIAKMKDDLEGQVKNLGTGLAAVAGVVGQVQKKAKGFQMKKGADKKTSAVVVHYDDGSSDEMPVQ